MTPRGLPVAAPWRVIALLLGFALVAVACGSGDEEELAAEDPVQVPDAGATTTEPTTTEPTTTTAAPTTTTEPPPAGGRQPDEEDPLRILFAGDSIGEELAAPAIAALRGGGSAVSYFVGSPDLARDPARRKLWEARLAQSNPDVIVLLVGVWERMHFIDERYRGRSLGQYRTQVVDRFVDLVTRDGAEVVWVGAPPVRESTASDQLEFLNGVFEQVAEDDERVRYVDGGPVLTTPRGGYVDVATNPDGTRERIRRIDGTHLCPGGAVRLATPVVHLIADRWQIPVGEGWPNQGWRHHVPFDDGDVDCPAVG